MELGAALAGRIRANEARGSGGPVQEMGDDGVPLPPGMTRKDALELAALQEEADQESAA
jgi:hypothetical protein